MNTQFLVDIESKANSLITFSFHSKEFAASFAKGFNAAAKTFLNTRKKTYLDFSMPENSAPDSHPFNRGWAMLFKLHQCYGELPSRIIAVVKLWTN